MNATQKGYMTKPSRYLAEALDVIAVAHATYPDSRDLALQHASLLAACEYRSEALRAAEEFLVSFGADDELLQCALKLRQRAGLYDRVSEGDQQSISLCMIVKDEEACLARCLASVKPVVHELVVVDTGSSDRTVAIANAFGARVVSFPWTGSFSDARNHGLDQAQGSWVLIMDADERIAVQDHQVVRQLLQSSTANDAWSVPIRNYSNRVQVQGWTANDGSYPAEEEADGWYPAARVRLFPNDQRIRYEGVVHELLEPSLRRHGFVIRTAPFVAHHYAEVDGLPQNQRTKQLRYYELGKQKLAEHPDDAVALYELAVQAAELELYEEALTFWDQLLITNPDLIDALFNKGYCLMALGRYSEALENSRHALELEPSHKEAAFNCGTCELYVGEPGHALTHLERIHAQYPDYPLATALLATLQVVQGQPQSASGLLDELRQGGYDITGYLSERASVLRQVGRCELAALIEQAVARL